MLEKTLYKRGAGFTLIETLIATALLLLLLTGAVSLASHSLSFASTYKHDLTATLLAQEGLEMLHYKRDTNILSGIPWYTGIITAPGNQAPCGRSSRACYAQLNKADGSITFVECSHPPNIDFTNGTSGCSPLQLDTTGSTAGLFSDSGIVTTQFVRTIRVESIGSPVPEAMRVTVMVTWPNRLGGLKKIILRETITNWP